MHIFRTAAAMALLVISFGACAQSPGPQKEPARIRGVISSVSDRTLVIRTREGADATVKLDEKTSVSTVLKASMSDIKPNTFVGVAAMPLPDGRLQALEIHIFPEAMRGVGEGSRPWDLAPGSTMTNGAVSGAAKVENGDMLTVSYNGGEKKIVVPADAPIVSYASAAMSDVAPGVGIVIVRAEPLPDGTFGAARITVGRNGVNPPM
ncbi:MAG: DUF5666 domain-containing protein [Beijerinckiaceae bacterium]